MFGGARMRRDTYTGNRSVALPKTSLKTLFPYDPSDWISSHELAIRLGKLRKDGKPSLGAIHTMVYRKQLDARKFFGRLMFSWTQVCRQIALSPPKGE